jgi:hypothetical protein
LQQVKQYNMKLDTLKEGDLGTITYSDLTQGKVELIRIDVKDNPMFTEYWFWYQEGETNRKGIHDESQEMFSLPGFVVEVAFIVEVTKEEREAYEIELKEYMKGFPEDLKEITLETIREIEKLAGIETVKKEVFTVI